MERNRNAMRSIALGIVVLAMAACDSGAGGSLTSVTPTTISPMAAVTPSSSASDSPSASGATGRATVTIVAPNDASTDRFAPTQVTVAADTPIEIRFRNDDVGVEHNVQIFPSTETTGTPLWAPADNAMITGKDAITYQVPALPAGTYAFNCFLHPATMFGTLTVG
jgi:plastocyanin